MFISAVKRQNILQIRKNEHENICATYVNATTYWNTDKFETHQNVNHGVLDQRDRKCPQKVSFFLGLWPLKKKLSGAPDSWGTDYLKDIY